MAKPVSGVVRVGLIGSGGISSAHGKGFIKHAAKIKVVALCDVSSDNLKKRSEQLKDVGGGGKQFVDWRVMLKEMAGEIDAVDICLPHHLHAPAILDAAAAGKHILCEKPMCMSLAEADQIAAAVSKAGVTYMSAHNQLVHAGRAGSQAADRRRRDRKNLLAAQPGLLPRRRRRRARRSKIPGARI
jgi:predicted dehydrogenase